VNAARSPGKLILSGEHAVVHGAPALVLAVDRTARVDLTPAADSTVTLRLADRPPFTLSLDDLPGRLEETRSRMERFRKGQLPIRNVCPEPEDLLLAALALAPPAQGSDIHIHSDIPLGAGLGSSAACLLALFKALRPDWTDDELYQHALHCEHFQHGRSSGIDVAASLHGGLLWSERGTHTPLNLDPPPAFTVYDTGRPETTTGECVAAVQSHFPTDHPVWNDFANVTRGLRSALQHQNPEATRHAIRQNHRLLTHIGVVPSPVADTVQQIEAAGGAAKICGAGAIRGDDAGMLLSIGPLPSNLPPQWTRLDLRPAPTGTHLVPELHK